MKLYKFLHNNDSSIILHIKVLKLLKYICIVAPAKVVVLSHYSLRDIYLYSRK